MQYIWFSNLSTLSVPDSGNSRNASWYLRFHKHQRKPKEQSKRTDNTETYATLGTRHSTREKIKKKTPHTKLIRWATRTQQNIGGVAVSASYKTPVVFLIFFLLLIKHSPCFSFSSPLVCLTAKHWYRYYSKAITCKVGRILNRNLIWSMTCGGIQVDPIIDVCLRYVHAFSDSAIYKN